MGFDVIDGELWDEETGEYAGPASGWISGDETPEDLALLVMRKRMDIEASIEEEMYKVFDLHHAGKRTIDIAIEMNRPPSTIRMIVKRLYQKHENAYQRWIEIQKQKESSSLVMEVFLNQLGYPFWDETNNPAYKLFLG